MIKFPCKDCPDRTITCHDTCPKYLDARAKQNEENEKRNQEAKNNPADLIIRRRDQYFRKELQNRPRKRKKN